MNKKLESLLIENEKLRKEIEELREYKYSTSLYIDILSTTSDLMSFIDENLIYKAINDNYLAYHKLSREQIIGFRVDEIWDKKTYDSKIKKFLEEALTGKKIKFSNWFEFKGVGKKYIEITYYPYSNEEKKIKGVVVRARDLTRQKLTSRALRESEKRFKALDDNQLLGFAVVQGMPPKFVYVNNTISKITGYPVGKLKGFSLEQIISLIYEEDRNLFKRVYPQLLDGTITKHSQVFRGVNNKGNIFWAEAFANKIEYKDEPAVLIAFKDVSEKIIAKENEEKYIRQLEQSKQNEEKKAEQLRELNKQILLREEQLKKENASKDKFFSIISHDLRSPFTALLGYAQLLDEDFDSFNLEEIKTAVQAMSKISHNIFQLIEGLLEWSRTRTGRIDFNPEKVDLLSSFKTVKIICEGSAKKKNINLKTDIDKSEYVFADAKMLDTILRNLVTNAIKFTNKGGEVSVEYKNDDKFYTIMVKDNGVGIDSTTIDSLFKIDVHHTTVGTDNEVGTGLGLIICKEFVEKNGGEIWVESEVGVGTKFLFTLPKFA